MYLKSLVLKGFKSFADRSVLALQPGITAVVGPNGSGKSNISDAVLWVLGERSARNLRGQAMEDIIFAGSAARKAVSVAEVDLVLDNTDHTLPVDFDEVVITRRMYRSGESEYLVNGVVSRRLDVLDILHDTGLGTGTHSIISQGSLDSILQSRPEDRRALIEEAAGVLKHKQRKEKAARKLSSMNNHLDRVRDVTAEVQRQLGPLERKAKRAEAYAKAKGELSELRLALAVDDLRELQKKWDEVLKAEEAALADIEVKRTDVSAAEQKVNDIQELMKRDSEDAGILAKRQRRAASLGERFDGAEMLLRERRRAAIAAEADLKNSFAEAAIRRESALKDLAIAKEQLEGMEAACREADENVQALEEKRQALEEKHRNIDEAINSINEELRQCDSELEETKRNQASLQEGLANGMANVKLVEARKAEIAQDCDRAASEHAAAVKALEDAKAQLEDIEKREHDAQEELISRFEHRDATHAARDEAHKNVHLLEVEAEGIEQSLLASRQDIPALQWVLDNASRFAGALSQVSKSFRVKRDLETLVENLLGDDLAALAVQDAPAADQIAAALAEGSLAGNVSVIMERDEAALRAAHARSCKVGHALVDDLEYSDSIQPVVEALLGDIVLCESRAEAFAAHADVGGALRFASPDGCVVYPNGKVRIFGSAEGEGEGVIARERRLDDLKESLSKALAERERADKAADEADEAYRIMQVDTLKLSQQLANCQGAHTSAMADQQRSERRLAAIEREIAEIDQQAEEAKLKIDGLKPDLEAVEEKIGDLTARRSALLGKRDEQAKEVEPLREQVASAIEELNEAKLASARMNERKTYNERIVIARERDIESVDAAAGDQERAIKLKAAAVSRADDLKELFERIATLLQRRINVVDESVAAHESSANDVHETATAARADARRAHDDYDAASARMSQVRVDKSRLEIRVEAAVNVIVDDLHVPIDHAQELPLLENRREVEDESFRLERRIKNMGSINPDAAKEYAELKERYDFLAGQLADMEAAQKALARITRVIDARMKDDFLNTYREVNENFNEIFSLLFPGGSAHLSLEDPDDIDNTGVEVTAQPRGKRLTKMMLMSGGEKSLTALALLFAVYKTRTTPFYILDEVEAALDDTNLRRLITYIDSLRATTQLIMITHQRRTMEMADVLFGVSMQADGVTKVISQKLERALEQAE